MFNKAATLTPTIKLCIDKEAPLGLEYSMEGMGILKFYLAPKIEAAE